jgi:hypothetical protein
MNYAQTGKSEMAELTKLVAMLAQQVSEIEKKIDSRPTGNYRKPPAVKPELLVQDRPPIVCYTCGEPGHISRRCPKKENTTGDKAGLNQIGNIDPNLLQGLLKQLGGQGQSAPLN